MKDRLCQYGNCQNTNVHISVNRRQERNSFCCDEHAILYLLKYTDKDKLEKAKS